jgi:hypothetical protein
VQELLRQGHGHLCGSQEDADASDAQGSHAHPELR